MKPGDLVKIIRAGIGVPKGTIGLILEIHKPFGYCDVQLYGLKYLRTVRRMPMDLEIISGTTQ